MHKEFRIFEQGKSNPVANCLQALCRELTIKLTLEGVASQPSLPVYVHADLHMSTQDIGKIRAQLDKIQPILTFRFAEDICYRAFRFKQLDKNFMTPLKELICKHCSAKDTPS